MTRCIRPAGPYAPGADLLTDKQATRLEDLFAGDDHVEVEATWGIYQRLVQAYRCTDPGLGSHLMASVIETIATGVSAQLTELVRLGHTLKHRATDILAFFDHPAPAAALTEALNGRLEHLRGSALGFRNLTHYIARCLLETGSFRPQLHPQIG